MKASISNSNKFEPEPDHFDVQMELKEIIADRKKSEKAFLSNLFIGFVAHGLLLSSLIFGLIYLIPDIKNKEIFAVIICGSYLITILTVVIGSAIKRIERMEIHALTVHESVLKVHDRLDEIITNKSSYGG